jgi:UDP-N-acetyl-D-glucosamine dehydrogenase
MEKTVLKFSNKEATIGILGLGYVGLPLVLRFSEVGFKVIGFDIDISKIESLNKGISYIKNIADVSIEKARESGFFPTADFSKIQDVDAVIICVPTPLNKYREPDLSYVINTFEAVLPYLKYNQVISLESTTYPGTTDEELKTRLESKGFVVGENIYLVFSPEREDPGNKNFKTKTIPKIVGGVTNECLSLGLALYNSVIDMVVPVSSTRAAEMTKLLENIHRAVNIGLVNEMKIICDEMGIDIHEVIRAAATKPFGFVPYYPGPGLGGHCIPIDPFYLTWKAREYGVNTRFIELAGEVNRSMPNWVLGKISNALNKLQKSIKGCNILVLGIAYKKNVDDMRESPAVELMELLQEQGATIAYSDPWVPVFPKMREHFFNLKSVELSPKIINHYDLILLATDHDIFDYEMIRLNARLIVDTRGVYLGSFVNVIKA